MAATTGEIAIVEAAIAALSDCGLTRTTLRQTIAQANDGMPSTNTATKKLALRVHSRDNVNGQTTHIDVPGPVQAAYPEQGTDIIALDNAIVAVAKTVFEANVLSPDGNTITVYGAELVGRRK